MCITNSNTIVCGLEYFLFFNHSNNNLPAKDWIRPSMNSCLLNGKTMSIQLVQCEGLIKKLAAALQILLKDFLTSDILFSDDPRLSFLFENRHTLILRHTMK